MVRDWNRAVGLGRGELHTVWGEQIIKIYLLCHIAMLYCSKNVHTYYALYYAQIKLL